MADEQDPVPASDAPERAGPGMPPADPAVAPSVSVTSVAVEAEPVAVEAAVELVEPVAVEAEPVPLEAAVELVEPVADADVDAADARAAAIAVDAPEAVEPADAGSAGEADTAVELAVAASAAESPLAVAATAAESELAVAATAIEPEPVETEPVRTEPVAVRPRRRRRRVLAVLLVLLLPVLLVAGAAGGLAAWDASFEGRILPGVHVGTADLSGLDRAGAAAAIEAAYPYQDGRFVLRTPDGDLHVPYSAFDRRPATDAIVDEAMASGRAGTPIERAVGEVRQALQGATIVPRAVFDRDALAAAIEAALVPLARTPVDATIAMGVSDVVTTPARAGRSVDARPVVDAAVTAIAAADAPSELVLQVGTQDIAPAVDDEAVANARSRAARIVSKVVLTYRKKRWTIQAGTVRSWVRFETRADGTIEPVVDTSGITAALAKPTRYLATPAVDARFLRTRGGRAVGVVAAKNGRAINAEATVAGIAAELQRRGLGGPAAPVAVVAKRVEPRLTTEEAEKTAPRMTKLGSWTTWFPISERNYWGANIWRPAMIINGTVLRPGQTFDWWNAIWPVTPARGFGPGGVIRSDHTDPTGALGGGMCSSSTTLFNAALRAGLRMGARSNHKYYINRYPLGLDATVSIMGGGRQTMTFTNDTRHPIVIRAYKIRGSGGRGYVRYEIWGVPDGRTISIGRASVSNVRRATTKVVTVTTLPHGVRKMTEAPSNGMDVTVVRVVRDGRGRVIHRDVYRSHYVLWNGRIEVGA
jgi:vancomycin resistance protein YoaR